MAIGTRQRATATRMIKKYGGLAKLRRASGDRDCYVYVTDYSPRERDGSLIQATDRVGLLVAEGLTVAPDNEQDILVTLDPDSLAELDNLKIVAPPGKLEVKGIIAYWELQLRELG